MNSNTLERPGDFVDGQFSPSATPEGEIEIQSPADLDDRVAVHPFATDQADRAVAAARRAQRQWRRTSDTERRNVLKAYQKRLLARRAELADAIKREVGKPRWEAEGEAGAMAAKVDVCLQPGAALTATQKVDELPGEIRYRPLGTLAVIGPFNFPGHLPNGQIVPALLLGNSVVHKPSERTPSTGYWMARCLEEAGLPRGVFNLVQGPGQVAARLASHPEVDGVLFTGSAAVGKRIVAGSLDRLDRLVALELGGKNASIVLDDCDLELAARQIAFAAYVTAGQRCSATSRVFVTSRVANRLCGRLAQLARSVRVGHPDEPEVFMGPMISGEARETLLAKQRRARVAGFEALVPGEAAEVPGRHGWYVRPGLHLAPAPGASVAGYTDTELFGPDMVIYVVSDVQQAIDRANDSDYGLVASVFTGSRTQFEQIASELEVGLVHWNRSSAGASSRLPFGGIKHSGNHRPAGLFAGLSCAYAQGVYLAPPPDAELPSWPGLRP